jgi:predicted flap endonuclease-1-like 5' DNA nuclease
MALIEWMSAYPLGAAALALAAGAAAGLLAGPLFGGSGRATRAAEAARSAADAELRRLREELRASQAVRGGLESALAEAMQGLAESEARLAALEEAAGTRPAPAPRLAPTRPPGLDEPRPGGPDPLTRLPGLSPHAQAVLNGLGIYHFDQIAAWTPAEAAFVEAHLAGAGGQVEGNGWIAAAAREAAAPPPFSNLIDESDRY